MLYDHPVCKINMYYVIIHQKVGGETRQCRGKEENGKGGNETEGKLLGATKIGTAVWAPAEVLQNATVHRLHRLPFAAD